MASIAVGADDAGAPLKQRLAAYLQDNGYQVEDYGNGDGLDYPDAAAAVAEAVARGEHDRVLLVCGTGLGMVMRPTRSPGPRPATEPITSPLTVSSNLRRRRIARRWAADPW